jgi:polyisoprenoid-binding protein YceI
MKNLNIKAGRYFIRCLTVIIVLSINAFTSKAQAQTAFKLMEGSQIKVIGTSNIHDWTMLAKIFTLDGNLVMKSGQLQDISVLNFVLPVKSLKSGESLMDTRAYKAMNAEKFYKMTFKLTEAIVVPQQKIIKAIGNLTIGGVTNKIEIKASYLVNGDETITLKGSKAIKMSDYKIKAPSFMMGALKTGNDLIIDILLKLKY